MGPTKNTKTKRDTRSVEQFGEVRCFKKPKQHQPDDDCPNDKDDDDDYKKEHEGSDEDEDNDEYVGAPVVVSCTHSSKGSTSCGMIECEDDDVGYEDLSKKLSHSFSGSGCSFTPKPSSQKKSNQFTWFTFFCRSS
jgi:hypothetical protein